VRAGRLDDAERLAEECQRLGTHAGGADAFGWYFAHLVSIRWLQGRGEEILPIVSELIHSPELAEPNESFLAAAAALAAWAGRSDEARAALQRLRGVHGVAGLRSSSTWMVTLQGVIEAAHLLGDATAAEEAYRLLAPYADLPVMASLAVTCFGSAHRPLGLAALTTGDAERAVRHLASAVDADLRLGNQPAHALSCAALSQALHARGAAGDAERAAALLDTAIEQGHRLGLTGRVVEWERQRVAAEVSGTSSAVDVRQAGRAWQVIAGSRMVEVRHSVGMTYLAELVRNPGVELSAVDLASRHELTADAQHDPVLDDRARKEYRQRVDELRAEIADADDDGDPERAARARLELDWLVDELSRITGLAGRARSFDDSAERARTSVQKAIKRALARISEADPFVGAAIRRRVVTGGRCVFLGMR
jgi:tetratricopeptide (TPR) repeat protein